MHDARQEHRLVVGFPDFAPTVEAEYPRFFEVGPRVLTAMHSVADREYEAPEPHQRAILNLAMVAGVSLVEVVTLTGNGLAHGAMKIVRSLMETAINVEYFRLRPAAFEDYRAWVHVERFRKIEFVREHLPDVFRTIDAETVATIAREMDRVRPRFEQVRQDGARRLRSSWSTQTLAERSAVAGFSDTYKTINPLASSFVHETMSGLIEHDQSIWPSRESQSNNTKWIKSQIPSCCQSRNRRQQLIPEPQPSLCGSIRQGIPLRRTKMMPERQARSVRRGRPPCGLGNGIGKRDSIKFHNASGTSAPAI